MPNFDQFSDIKKYKEEKTSWLPRLDKIRLGIKVRKEGKQPYPKEVDYFVVPEKLMPAIGGKPKEITIHFPVADRSKIFPYAYKYYGSSQGLKCIGNGEFAMERQEDRTWKEGKPCPCELLSKPKGCSQRGHLQFMIQDAGMGGVYQIDTSSEISIKGINNDLDFITSLVGRFTFIPITLKRIPTETHNEGKKQTHYTMRLECDATMDEIAMMRSNPDRVFKRNQDGRIVPASINIARYELPEPADENPAFDEGGVLADNLKEEYYTGPDPSKFSKEEPVPPGSFWDIVTLDEFHKLPKENRITAILVCCKFLDIEQPTPAPLEEHSLKELADIYDYILKNYGDKLQTAKGKSNL